MSLTRVSDNRSLQQRNKGSYQINADQFSHILCPLTAVGKPDNMSRDYNSGFDPVGYLEWRWDPSKADKDVRYIRYKIATFMAHFYQDLMAHTFLNKPTLPLCKLHCALIAALCILTLPALIL